MSCQNGVVTIPKSTKPDRIDENCQVSLNHKHGKKKRIPNLGAVHILRLKPRSLLQHIYIHNNGYVHTEKTRNVNGPLVI